MIDIVYFAIGFIVGACIAVFLFHVHFDKLVEKYVVAQNRCERMNLALLKMPHAKATVVEPILSKVYTVCLCGQLIRKFDSPDAHRNKRMAEELAEKLNESL